MEIYASLEPKRGAIVTIGNNTKNNNDRHLADITDLAMIDAGKNIVSSSMDGTIRIWDCGTQSQIHCFGQPSLLKKKKHCFVCVSL